ncbi:DUF6898 family protein [Arenibaculum sp.]|jgi:hypothetical protein|uniref:DUF6898 family protein n=1 Tax=Arenibaculum sp. TaxID=2865862 RepID=UPI002E132554|nr:hypothetical protein [Arenibaculum sp.]
MEKAAAMGGEREVLIEFQRVGMYLKATAVDPDTLTEVSVVGPLHAEAQLKRTVVAKLSYVLARKR